MAGDERPADLGALRAWLREVPPGPVAGASRDELLGRLAACWDLFDGSGKAAMGAHKLHRAEDVTWDPPRLTFMVERHGAAARGSIYAEAQGWAVDLEEATAEVSDRYGSGRRRTRPAAPWLDVRLPFPSARSPG